ncbi:MAG: LysR family transcriptional regulator [Pseudomonadota bacterium]
MPHPKTTLDQWRALQAVIDHGGYAQAAERLHRSQSSISYAIARLQDALGLELLVIEGRKARLTEAGRTLLGRSRELSAKAVALEELAAALRQGWEAEVRLAVEAAFPTEVLLHALAHFAGRAPQTRVQLREEVLSGTDEACRDGSADLVISSGMPLGLLGDRLIEVEFIAVAHPDHALHRLGRALTADDLMQAPQIVLRDSGHRQPRDGGWVDAPMRWTVTSMDTALRMVGAGLGFAWLPAHLLRGPLTEGRVRPLPLREGQRHTESLYLIFVRPELSGPATRLLADMLLDAVNALPRPPG